MAHIAVEAASRHLNGVSYIVGTCPSAIASDPSSSYVYVTDVANGKVLGYSVASGTWPLDSAQRQPFQTGNQPSAIVADPKYPYLYVANALDSTVRPTP